MNDTKVVNRKRLMMFGIALLILGAIAVLELTQPVDVASITASFVEAGIWVRPFGRLVYLMPAYIINDSELTQLCNRLSDIVAQRPG